MTQPRQPHPNSHRYRGLLFASFLLLLLFQTKLPADELSEAQSAYLDGDYGRAIELSEVEMNKRYWNQTWSVLRIRAELALGLYEEALTTVRKSIERHPRSIQIRLLGHDLFRRKGQTEESETNLEQMATLVSTRSWAYREGADLVALGVIAQLIGEDARIVMDNALEPAKKADPAVREAFIEYGKIALTKRDFDLAARNFEDGLEIFPRDPDLLWGLAKSFAKSDRGKMLEYLQSALERNPRHVPSLLLLTDHLVDAEDYLNAEVQLAAIDKVNPQHPKAWAYRAVLAHLRSDGTAEAEARQKALTAWPNNPDVDHLIGCKLSQKYRFKEGAERQRLALSFDPTSTAAKIQLAQDLLRLGEEEEGWTLAESVHQEDGYNIEAFNLVSLKDVMDKFVTLETEHFILRLPANEAPLYGENALALLEEARKTLTERYEVKLPQKTTVEIFDNQNDFGVRTFGMPDNPGYLGVCFGPVITANSPASNRGGPVNWEAVLWHEFAHVITLHITKNKMPRWLSEGISVYEEVVRNPLWGQPMSPAYRDRIVNDRLSKIGDLSEAFLSPEGPDDLDFAYFQSYLVVEFLIQNYGQSAVTAILHALGEGRPINDALAGFTAPMETLEEQFEAFAKDQARALGPELQWDRPEEGIGGIFDAKALELAHPDNYWVLIEKANRMIENENWQEAERILINLIERFPEQTGDQNAYAMLSQVMSAQGRREEQKAMIEKWANSRNNAVDAYSFLMRAAEDEADWNNVVSNARRYLAVNPLVPEPHRHMARACEHLGHSHQAISSLKKLLALDPPDPADIHYRLSNLLTETSPAEAKYHVLMALEAAPRFRDGHKQLLRLVRQLKVTDEP